MNKNDIKKIIASLVARVKKERAVRAGSLMNPHRDWALVLIIFTVVTIGSVAGSAYLFLQISKGEIFLVEPEQTRTLETIDQALLSKTLFFYEEQKRQHALLQENPPSLADPLR